MEPNSPTRYSYGVAYYNMFQPLLNLQDFSYIKEVTLNTVNLYIVREVKDVIKHLFNRSKMIDLVKVNKHFAKPLDGVLVFNTSGMLPVFHIFNLKCVVNVKTLQKRFPEQGNTFIWNAQINCETLDSIKCLDADTCQLTKKDTCTSYQDVKALQANNLSVVMKPYKYYTFSEHPITFNETTLLQRPNHKPFGLWFALGDSWLKYIKDNDMKQNHNYLYELELNTSTLYTISTYKELMAFSYAFRDAKTNVVSTTPFTIIDWHKVVKKTKSSGILIPHDFQSLYWKYSSHNDWQDYFKDAEWYMTWDIPSGAVWKSDAIKKLTLVYKKEEGKFKKYSSSVRKPRKMPVK